MNKLLILAILCASVFCQAGDILENADCSGNIYGCVFASDLGCDTGTTDQCKGLAESCTDGTQAAECLAKFGQVFTTCDTNVCGVCADDAACAVADNKWYTCVAHDAVGRDAHTSPFGCVLNTATSEADCTNAAFGLFNTDHCLACTVAAGVQAGCTGVSGMGVCNGGTCEACSADGDCNADHTCNGGNCLANIANCTTYTDATTQAACSECAAGNYPDSTDASTCVASTATGCATVATDDADVCASCATEGHTVQEGNCAAPASGSGDGESGDGEGSGSGSGSGSGDGEGSGSGSGSGDGSGDGSGSGSGSGDGSEDGEANDTTKTTCDVTDLTDLGCVGCDTGADKCANCGSALEIGPDGNCKCPGDKIPDTTNGCVAKPDNAPTCSGEEKLAVVDGEAKCLSGADLTDAIKKGNAAAAAAAEEDDSNGLLLSILSIVSMIVLA